MKRLEDHQKNLRLDLTEPEKILWTCLRAGRCGGMKFRRQVPIGPYVVDFLCVSQKMIIEIDGDEHDQRQKYDEQRTQYLESLGFVVLRYSNQDVTTNKEGIVRTLMANA